MYHENNRKFHLGHWNIHEKIKKKIHFHLLNYKKEMLHYSSIELELNEFIRVHFVSSNVWTYLTFKVYIIIIY